MDLAQGQLRAFKRMPTKTSASKTKEPMSHEHKGTWISIPAVRAANVGWFWEAQSSGSRSEPLLRSGFFQRSLEAIAMALTFVGVILGIFALAKSECLGVGRVYAQMQFGAMAIGNTLVQTSNETLACISTRTAS